MKRLAVIPARGGSKRIPRKNIRLFHGKPIIAYSIENALRSGLFDQVIVSTDDADIAATAQEWGAAVPFMRPAHLADDFTGTQAVVQHAVEFFSSQKIHFEQTCCIYATAPLATQEVLQQGCHLLSQNDCDYVVTVAEFRFPPQRALCYADNGRVTPMCPGEIAKRSQDLPKTFHDAGQIYWGATAAFMENRAIWGSATMPLMLPATQVQDIDTNEDWLLAEMKYQFLQNNRGGDL
ncbi:MAG: pseudaminic acid cytidylyltransferase [Cellvibrionaceae bacterium]|nr:pseudaminic acid cytidylyltransferase [Cellvibrionaceae bacterium]